MSNNPGSSPRSAAPPRRSAAHSPRVTPHAAPATHRTDTSQPGDPTRRLQFAILGPPSPPFPPPSSCWTSRTIPATTSTAPSVAAIRAARDAGDVMPPIIAEKGTDPVVDGFHRVLGRARGRQSTRDRGRVRGHAGDDDRSPTRAAQPPPRGRVPRLRFGPRLRDGRRPGHAPG